MSLQFGVVYEAIADFETATELADRVLLEAIVWLDEFLLPGQRTWRGELPGGRRLTWTAISTLARDAGIRVHGHFAGEPGLDNAKKARRAIRYLREELPYLDAIVLVGDQDDYLERRGGMEQARNQAHSIIPIVVALPVIMRECWILSGFEPLDEDEEKRLRAERTYLGFDPRVKSHELTANDESAKRSPKRVLRAISEGDEDREHRCWRETPLQTLRERGTENGLNGYLEEVRDRLAPLIGHTPP